GTLVSYLWTKLSGVAGTLDDATLISPALSGLTTGTYVFELTVTDNDGLTDTDTVTITVTTDGGQTGAPIANAGTDVSLILPTNSVTLDGSQSSDSDGTLVSYLWTKLSGAALTIDDATLIGPVLSGLTTGTYVFELTVTDNDGLTDTDTVTITVEEEQLDACGVSHSIRDILLEFYQATNGANWTNTLANNQPWDINIPVCDWYGITTGLNSTTAKFGVLDIYLSNNNLEGYIPESLGDLPEYKNIDLSNNKLSGGSVPVLKAFLSTIIKNNEFVFGDLEENILENINYPRANSLIFDYYPQAKVDEEETLIAIEGQSITLTSTRLYSTSNTYQWYKNGVAITGATSKNYVISSPTVADEGFYHFLADNPNMSNLTLERRPITLIVNSSTPPITTYCPEAASAEAALTNLLNHLIDEVRLGTEIPSVYNPSEMQALAPYINCSNPAVYNLDFSYPDEAMIAINFSYGIDCCQQSFTLYWDHVTLQGQGLSTKESLVDFKSISISETLDSYTVVYDYIDKDNNLDIANSLINFLGYTAYPDTNDFGITLSMDCLNISCNSNNANIFCSNGLEEDLTVADLSPSGTNIEWYTTETGGVAIDSTEELVEETVDLGGITYWWDDPTDAISTRTGTLVQVLVAIEGENQQLFSKYGPVPTIADIEVYNSDEPVFWYSSDSSVIVLSTNTPLEHGKTYYASPCDAGNTNCVCRFPVTIILGVIPPEGDRVQYLCEQSTLDDIVLEFEDEYGLSVQWYDSEEGGNLLAGNTPVVSDTTYYASQIDSTNNEESEIREAVLVSVQSPPDAPVVKDSTQKFYASNLPTVAHLRATGANIKWYSQLEDGNVYDESHLLVDGTIYYAEQVFGLGSCSSIIRVPVTVEISNEPADPLYGCELFRPELLGHYVVDGWVNEREVSSEETASLPFNDSDKSKLFVALLNHLKNRLMSTNEKLRDIPAEYDPVFTAEEEQLDLAPLMGYIEGLSNNEEKLIVYDFKAENDSYGRAIGFSFYLNAAKSPDKQFVYKTPVFTYSVPNVTSTGVTEITKTEHYPLSDNEESTNDDYLNFTDVRVTDSGAFEIDADFNQVSEPIHQESQVSTESNSNVIKSEITLFKYTEVAYQAAQTYTNTEIEISFLDPEGDAIGSTMLFSPHGDIIDKWQKITGDFTVPNGAGKMIISLKNNDPNKIAYFDDLRILPYNGNIKTFVYHPENQRLMSELDENNYATFYEYDAEGGLIRVKKETVKGTYTIQETRSGNIKATN
ncbi:MAG: PKD domain-containing protein, partial [Algibacter sp.]